MLGELPISVEGDTRNKTATHVRLQDNFSGAHGQNWPTDMDQSGPAEDKI